MMKIIFNEYEKQGEKFMNDSTIGKPIEPMITPKSRDFLNFLLKGNITPEGVELILERQIEDIYTAFREAFLGLYDNPTEKMGWLVDEYYENFTELENAIITIGAKHGDDEIECRKEITSSIKQCMNI